MGHTSREISDELDQTRAELERDLQVVSEATRQTIRQVIPIAVGAIVVVGAGAAAWFLIQRRRRTRLDVMKDSLKRVKKTAQRWKPEIPKVHVVINGDPEMAQPNRLATAATELASSIAQTAVHAFMTGKIAEKTARTESQRAA